MYVETYTNGNLDANKTKPRTRHCRTYSTVLSVTGISQVPLLFSLISQPNVEGFKLNIAYFDASPYPIKLTFNAYLWYEVRVAFQREVLRTQGPNSIALKKRTKIRTKNRSSSETGLKTGFQPDFRTVFRSVFSY